MFSGNLNFDEQVYIMYCLIVRKDCNSQGMPKNKLHAVFVVLIIISRIYLMPCLLGVEAS